MKRVTGIGGIFFQSESPNHLYEWYEKHLGIKREPHGQGAAFEWRELQSPDGSQPGAKGTTAWAIFPKSTKYFGASKASFMLNYRVDDLDALLEELKTGRSRDRSASRGRRLRTVRVDHGSRRKPN